jgi:hypothetical protein
MHQQNSDTLYALQNCPTVHNVPAKLHSPPKVIGVKVSREFGIDLYNMHISLCSVPHNRLVVLARGLVRLDINA